MEQDFTGRLYRLRRERGISQEELAAMVGVSRQAVQKWESGASRPDMDNLAALCGCFGVSMDYLVLGTGPSDRPSAPSERDPWEADDSRVSAGTGADRGEEWHYEYKSTAALFGLPLVHVNFGSGRGHRARGIVAMGNSAVGLVAAGYTAVGLVSVGLVSVGLLALGLLAVGLVALGGVAIGAALACGGVAVGRLALGGVAVGVYALGGVAVGLNAAAGGLAVGHVAIGKAAESTGDILFRVGGNLPDQGEAIRTALRAEFPGLPEWLARILSAVK